VDEGSDMDYQLILLNAREGGMPKLFEMETVSSGSATNQTVHFKFWR
jgi:hypothetical protein